MKSILELKTEKILLRDIEGSDIDTVFRGLSNPDVIKHYGVSFDSLEETKEQMKWFSDTKQKWFAICSADNNVFYGAGGLNDISKKHKKAEIGLWLLPEYWGKGYATGGAKACLDYGKDTLKLKKVISTAPQINKPSINVMKKIGMKKKLEFIHPKVKDNERLRNCVCYEIDFQKNPNFDKSYKI